ncbi:MAG: tetratricopeptide repeat protein [Candidatus Latescibacterota bacterium]|nr:tetratricopeptide repeat protein [Candidatus Latescibacterota bacterium]
MLVSASIIFLLLFSYSCVYFNTFYNAEKYFRQAEKARQGHEKLYAGWELEDDLNDQFQRPRPQKAEQLYDKAARKASKVLEKYRDSDLVDDAMFLMGRSFYWRAEYLRAIQAFRDLEINFPDSEFCTRSRYWRAKCLEDQRIDGQAQALYRELFEEGDDEIAANAGWRLSEMAILREDYVAASRQLQETLESYPNSSITSLLWLKLAVALGALEDSTRFVEIEYALNNVLDGNPDFDQEYRARLNLGKMRYNQGDVEGALGIYLGLLRNSSFRVYEGRTRLLIGRYYEDRGNHEIATNEYEKVRDDFPGSPASAMALYQTGMLHMQLYGDIDLAQEYFHEAGREKSGSQADLLAKQMLGHLNRLNNLTLSIQLADSLAADSLTIDSLNDTTEVDLPDVSDSVAVSNKDTAVVVSRSLETLDELFTIAEIYRDDVGQVDSSIAYYEEIISRYPTSEQLPRALYSIAWILTELNSDPIGAEVFLAELIEQYPTSLQANEARQLLGLPLLQTEDEKATQLFREIENRRLKNPEVTESYIPALDRLSSEFSGSQMGAKALYVAATSFEDIVGDTVQAEIRYEKLRKDFYETELGKLAIARQEARLNGAIAKLERGIKGLGGKPKPGEKISFLSVEPDTSDSIFRANKYLAFGLRAHRRGNTAQARDFFEQSVEEMLNNPQGLYMLGLVSLDEGFYNEALEFFYQTLVFSPGHLNSKYRLFDYYLADTNEDSAQKYLQELIQRDRKNLQLRYIREQNPEILQGEPLTAAEMQGFGVTPPDEVFEISTHVLKLAEEPIVRKVVFPDSKNLSGNDSLEVLVDVLIDKNGNVGEAKLFRGEEPYASIAVEAAQEYLFYPALKHDEEPINVWVELTIPFIPESSFREGMNRKNTR